MINNNGSSADPCGIPLFYLSDIEELKMVLEFTCETRPCVFSCL